MSQLGQSRRFGEVRATSALPPIADLRRGNGTSETCQIRTHAVQQSTFSITSLARASNGRLMSGLRLPADSAMASALFGLGSEAHQER
jgi:hypothetical protein